MEVIVSVTTLIVLIIVLRNLIYWAYLLKSNNYGLDSLILHVRETDQDTLPRIISFLKLTGIILYIPSILSDTLVYPYYIFVIIVVLLDFYVLLDNALTYKEKWMRLATRDLLMIIMAFATISVLALIPISDPFFWLLVLERLSVLALMFFSVAFSFPAEIYDELQVSKATKLLAKHHNLLVIFVCGDYVREQTADYLEQVISRKYKTYKIPYPAGNIRELASDIYKNVTDDIEALIVQIKTRADSDLLTIGELLKPNTVIYTGIKKENSKYYGVGHLHEERYLSLLLTLPEHGLAVINAEGNISAKAIVKTALRSRLTDKSKQCVLYQSNMYFQTGLDTQRFIPMTVSADNILTRRLSTSFDLLIDGRRERISTRLMGEENIKALLPAIIVAKYLGLSNTMVKKFVPELVPSVRGMRAYLDSNNNLIVEKTYTDSVSALINAIGYLSSCPERKLLVIGNEPSADYSGVSHYLQIMDMLNSNCLDAVILSNSYYRKLSASDHKLPRQCRLINGRNNGWKEIRNLLSMRNTTVLFFGSKAAGMGRQAVSFSSASAVALG